MSRLASAHRGYEYQDLLVALRLVDVLLGTVTEVHCDEKLVKDDRFDDLTTVDLDGLRERVQFKHTQDDDRSLTLETFTGDRRSLRLDRLIASILADRKGPGRDATKATFRVVLRDRAPTDPQLTAVLRPAPSEANSFLAGTRTQRFRFDSAELWAQRQPSDRPQPFAFLFDGESPPTRDNLVWACDHLLIEVDAPRASLDLTDPDAAEQLLLLRARTDVGAETFPNVDRSAVDVAGALVSAARAARQGVLTLNSQELLRRLQLKSDFGAVARAHPVARSIEVDRNSVVRGLVGAAGEVATTGRPLVIVGPPGHGKSWVCQQLVEALDEHGWLVAEHYCYLGDADGERHERVLAEAVLGSLLGRLADADPRLVQGQRPRFAADEDALVRALQTSRDVDPDRRIALVVDGIDHITRVRAWRDRAFDPSRSMSETLAALDLPRGVALIVLSQPGNHLASLSEAGAESVAVPGLERHELQSLAARLGLIPSDDDTAAPTQVLIEGEAVDSVVDVLAERSKGNALYATYICREMRLSSRIHADPASVISELPPFDGTLANYYDHLYSSLGPETDWVADVIALTGFALTRTELREIRPDAAHRIDSALEKLAPVLTERATQGGVSVYHESFARYLRLPFQQAPEALTELLRRITRWLETKGLFADPRAFRFLLPLLAEAEDDKRLIELVDSRFVIDAVAAGYAASAINANLATAIGAAARLSEWPVIVRYVELARAADSYQEERLEEQLVSFVDVPAALIGADVFAARLLDEDRPVMSGRAGLQMCAAVDSLGAAAPWRTYMEAYLREVDQDNTMYGEASDRAVALAWLRGRLRLTSEGSTVTVPPLATDRANDDQWNVTSPIDWDRAALSITHEDLDPRDVVAAVLDTHGWAGITALVESLPNPAGMCIAVAEALTGEALDSPATADAPTDWAAKALRHGIPPGSARRLLELGVPPSAVEKAIGRYDRERLLDLTREVQTKAAQGENEPVEAWLDVCAVAAQLDELGLGAAEAIVTGEGWYPCWLRFAICLSRAEAAAPAARGELALTALELLTGDLRPFAGDPRSCDLYRLHPIISETLSLAMKLLDDDQWRSGLDVLREVTNSITTTISGELGGPVPPDLVVSLAVAGVSPERHAAAEDLVLEQIERGSGERYYSDIAEFRLHAARLALAANDRRRAHARWREACVFLTAYGWHKDVTIYELLDPFPDLIRADPRAARKRLSALQRLCERVPAHTDGRETRGAWTRWWSLASQADPVGATGLAVPQLLARCNDPNWLLDEALEYVWRNWHSAADPMVAAALRLTLDTPLTKHDARQLRHLADRSAQPVSRQLLVWLLARADERPVSYAFTNASELLARDDEKVADLNEVAEQAQLPTVVALRDLSDPEDESDRLPTHAAESAAAAIVPAFPPGMPGLVKAIRTWQRRPYDASAAGWGVERFANVIGYRLIGLLDSNRSDDAASVLTTLANGLRTDERTAILRSIAEGLERHGKIQLAARAYALTWVHTRGGGGWLTFGGETDIESLAQATALDAEAARAVVSEEIEVTIAAGSPFGISQAIIFAFAAGALRVPEGTATELAFDAWDEAFDVISSRAPWVNESDNPDVAYSPPEVDAGERAPGDLDSALALASIGSLAHPSREKKRRALLAARVLIDERAASVAPAVARALSTISDPASLTWLLCLLDSSKAKTDEAFAQCQSALERLAMGDLLTVRAIARRLVRRDTLGVPPSTRLRPPEPTGQLWKPDESDADETEPSDLAEMLGSVVGRRIQRGERIFSELRSAFDATAGSMVNSDAVKERLRRQLRTLSSATDTRWPDAFLAPVEACETALQQAAATGRATLAMSGRPVLDPIGWEDALASAITGDPTLPLTLEAHRQPRPHLPPPPGAGDDVWTDAKQDDDESDSDAPEPERLLLATLTLDSAQCLPRVQTGVYRDWCWLATAERRLIKRPGWNKDRDLVADRYRVAEVRNLGDSQGLGLPPIGEANLRWWRADVEAEASSSLRTVSQALVGLDWDLEVAGDSHEGLGIPRALLVPLPSVVSLLELRPGDPCSYADSSGVGMALVTWRAEYDVSDYHLAFPRICGSGIVLRPDLVAKLLAETGKDRVVVRDFVVGDPALQAVSSPTKTPD